MAKKKIPDAWLEWKSWCISKSKIQQSAMEPDNYNESRCIMKHVKSNGVFVPLKILKIGADENRRSP